MRKNPTAAAMILKALWKNPNQTPSELMKATERSNSLIYSALKNLSKKGLVRRDNLYGTYSLSPLPKKAVEPTTKVVMEHNDSAWVNTTKVSNAIIESQRNQIEQLRNDLTKKDQEILKMKIDILDQAAVVNYLEKKLDKRDE